jgi:hypothetical protein
MRRWLASEPPARWLLIEPDAELRRIVIFEMEPELAELALPVEGCTFEDCAAAAKLERSLPLVLPSKAERARGLLPAGLDLTVLDVNPVASALQMNLEKYLPEHAGDLLGIASRWSEFQRIARTMIVAVGLAPDNLLVRDATQPGWKRGLESASAVICDAALAGELPRGCFPLVFRLLNDASIAKLREVEAGVSDQPEVSPSATPRL